MEGLVLGGFKVIGDRHALAFAHGEGEGVGAGSAELLNDARGLLNDAIWTGVSSYDTNAGDEALQTEPLSVRESTFGSERIGLPALMYIFEA